MTARVVAVSSYGNDTCYFEREKEPNARGSDRSKVRPTHRSVEKLSRLSAINVLHNSIRARIDTPYSSTTAWYASIVNKV